MVSPTSSKALKSAATLLGVEIDELQGALVSRVMQTQKAGTKGTVIRFDVSPPSPPPTNTSPNLLPFLFPPHPPPYLSHPHP